MTFNADHWAAKVILIIVLITLTGTLQAGAGAPTAEERDIPRFRYSGDGRIWLVSEKNTHIFNGAFRSGKGHYDQEALKAIHLVFDAPAYDSSKMDSSTTDVSLRLIEYLDYIEDHLNPGARITLISGYRAPSYNTALRDQGKLAAKASLHQYGMASDVKLDGVPASKLWEFVKACGFGGAGYYHGRSVHIDVGPSRSWDETNSGVGSGISDDNKLIGLVTEYDAYLPGETVRLSFIRMTAFPIAIQGQMILEKGIDPAAASQAREAIPFAFQSPLGAPADRGCLQFANLTAMARLFWRLPASLSEGSYRISALRCGDAWPEMPAVIETPEFRVISP